MGVIFSSLNKNVFFYRWETLLIYDNETLNLFMWQEQLSQHFVARTNWMMCWKYRNYCMKDDTEMVKNKVIQKHIQCIVEYL